MALDALGPVARGSRKSGNGAALDVRAKVDTLGGPRTSPRTAFPTLAGAAPSGEEQHGVRHDLERLVRELPPRQRRLLRLSFGLGLDLRELARLLGGAKPESIRRARWRAITRLRELLAAER